MRSPNKIGIITHYYKSTNYGGNLQAYALCKVLQMMGYEAEQICYSRQGEPPMWKAEKLPATKELLNTFRKAHRGVNLLLSFLQRDVKANVNVRKQAILGFNRSDIPHSSMVFSHNTIAEANRDYDVFITGSDQVWHPMAVCDAYLLSFAEKGKISYAASLAVNELAEEQKSKFQNRLSAFDAVSVREKNAVDILRPLVNNEPTWVLDPSLLLSREEWDAICTEVKVSEKYLFCYFLGDDIQQRRLAESYAKTHGLKIVTLPYLNGKYRKCDKKFGDIRLYDVSPKDLLSLIKYADYVFTDSFHATVFSIIYQREFFVFDRSEHKEMGSRIGSLTELFSLQLRYCNTPERLTLAYLTSIPAVDYSQDFSLFEKRRSVSIQFLKDSIESVTRVRKTNMGERLEGFSNIVESLQTKRNCSGCYSCVSACPQKCITMKNDNEGFWYPDIDEKLCIQCGLCEKKCPIINMPRSQKSESDISAYAAYTKDPQIREKSSSGGLFTEIANYVLHREGVVFGAAFDDDLNLKHMSVESIEDIEKLQGSKYIQSNIGTAYQDAKNYLDANRLVLFTGTPCQIAGLYSYLGKQYDNLITQDIVCHGVPSPIVWKRYIKHQESLAGSKIQRVNFREKISGWKDYSIGLVFLNRRKYTKLIREDLYMQSFLKNLSLRPSCYACSFKKKIRQSDFTLADFWGIEKVFPEMDDDKGISLVLANSDKGQAIFSEISENIYYRPVDIDEAIRYNSAATASPEKSIQRDLFMQSIGNDDFKTVVNRFTKVSAFSKCIAMVKKLLK